MPKTETTYWMAVKDWDGTDDESFRPFKVSEYCAHDYESAAEAFVEYSDDECSVISNSDGVEVWIKESEEGPVVAKVNVTAEAVVNYNASLIESKTESST